MAGCRGQGVVLVLVVPQFQACARMQQCRAGDADGGGLVASALLWKRPLSLL